MEGGLFNPDAAWVCVKCGALPRFTRRMEWGFNMRDAFCVTPDCPGGVWEPKGASERRAARIIADKFALDDLDADLRAEARQAEIDAEDRPEREEE